MIVDSGIKLMRGSIISTRNTTLFIIMHSLLTKKQLIESLTLRKANKRIDFIFIRNENPITLEKNGHFLQKIPKQ